MLEGSELWQVVEWWEEKNEGKWMHKETTRQKLMTYNSGLQIHGN